jgi:hypothetical protein
MIDFAKLPLGKGAPEKDKDSIKHGNALRAAFMTIAPAPSVLHTDNCTSNPMDGNDVWGCCVMAARAHMTDRFETYEAGARPPGTTQDVLTRYWIEQGWKPGMSTPTPGGKYDNGLVELKSLNSWKKDGWTYGGKQYSIAAHGDINWKDPQELANTIYYLNGVFCGVALPISAQAQTGPGKVWDVATGKKGVAGSWGLHGIYLPQDYDIVKGLWKCITWGAEQWMTTAFINKYFDESHGVVDNRDPWLPNSPVNSQAQEAILNALELAK